MSLINGSDYTSISCNDNISTIENYQELSTYNNEDIPINESIDDNEETPLRIEETPLRIEETPLRIEEPVNNKKPNKRLYWVDVLRIIACYLVILTHSCGHFLEKEKVGKRNFKILYFYNSLARPCVPLFIMISGIFFLNPKKKISYKQVFTKYVFRILKCYIFWSFYYNVIENYLIYYNSNTKIDKNAFKYMLGATITGNGHALWYLNFVIGLYISTPIFKAITEDRSLTIYAIVLFSTVTQFIPTLSNIILHYFKSKRVSDILTKYTNGLCFEVAGSYATYYLLGYLLNDVDLSKKHIYRYLFYIVGIVGSISTIILRAADNNNEKFVQFYSFNVNMATVGIFIFHKYVFSKFVDYIVKVNFIKSLISSLSECSLGIYLIHMAIFRAYAKFHIHSYDVIDPIFGVPIFSFVVLLTCYIIIYLLRKIPIFKTLT
ncbi:hypothetical protein BCR32DRAFT_287175 [Anaeromyces robustus]|uniref:Acyltransferase 3 domain-containing protein n=1 Tax=Anaeromyces robustus TaxID=1754192 RepID=A0A1Y1VT12_9FUNG|nr:hypothetical protein BCR32DRAFT_287175 [Anaeromyces robustus]|eukprot:ORX64313.1 hypothetical protein BCR32DRAFT_287175 [Anaeromyces robustus]